MNELMMKPLEGYILLCLYVYVFIRSWLCHGFWWYYVVLRAPMDDLLQRSHMGRYYFHSTEAVWELSSGRVVGVSTWCRLCWNTRVNTSVGSLYTIFGFSYYIKYIKEHWWSLTLSWPDEVQRMVFDRPLVFKNEV